MIIQDRVFGELEIVDKNIIRLIETKAFKRLKEINQYGSIKFLFKEAYQVTRFEHSIGVWHILKTLGASYEEQIAGLLHDIGHTAMSHLVDMAMEDEAENFHENNLGLLEGYEEVQSILKDLNLDLKDVDEYSVIKKSLPDVGADRIDYAIRDYVGVTALKKDLGKKVLENCKIIDGSIIFLNKDVAKEFATTGLDAMWLVIYDPEIAAVYQSTIEILRKGITDGWITNKDLYKTDKHVFQLMKKNRDKFGEKHFRVFEDRFNVIQTEKDYDFKHVKLKARVFDPKVLVNNELKRVSELDEEFSKFLEKMSAIFEERKKGLGLKVVF